MTPVVLMVLHLCIAAVSPAAVNRKGGQETSSSLFEKIENANANISISSQLTHGDIMGDADGILRNAVPCTSTGCTWPKVGNEVIVPYRIARGFSRAQKRVIRNALSELESGTCVRFVKKTGSDTSYIDVISSSGCWSYLGRLENGQQISLQKRGCVFKEIVQHEFLHALGFHHEHVRSDRDENVIINFDNIRPGVERNFQIAQTNNLGTPYDFQSVMHYGKYDFSVNGQPTITAIDSSITTFGTAKEMSDNDFDRVNRLYEC